MKVIVMTGLPLVGKTTIARLFTVPHSVCSSEEDVLAALTEGNDAVYDAQNLSADDRINFVRKVKERWPAIQVVCVYVQASLTDYLNRLDAAGQYVPIKALAQLNKDLRVPDYAEGFDLIITAQVEGG